MYHASCCHCSPSKAPIETPYQVSAVALICVYRQEDCSSHTNIARALRCPNFVLGNTSQGLSQLNSRCSVIDSFLMVTQGSGGREGIALW